MLIVDPSAVAKWFLDDEKSEAADSILDRIEAGETGLVPEIFRWEIENALLCAQRAGRIDADEVDEAFEALRDLPIRFETSDGRFATGAEVQLARAYDLTVYDAAYLACAGSHGGELVTADGPLERAARDLGIQTLFVD